MSAPDVPQNPPATLDAIRAAMPSLIPSERRVAARIVDDPDTVLNMSAAEVAAATQTSAATVSRACQNLGFQGFQHLRLRLARDVGARRRRESTAEPGVRGYLRAVFGGASQALDSAADALDPDAFTDAVERVRSAERLLVVGAGGSAAVAQSFAFRMAASARSCEAPPDSVAQQLTAAGLGAKDVCVAVSESGSNGLTLNAARAAQESGAAVIGVTAYSRTSLTDLADVSLIAGAGYHAWMEERLGGNIVLMLVLGALHGAVMHSDHVGAESVLLRDAVLKRVVDIIEE